MRQERKAPSSSSRAHKANSTPSSLKMEEVGTTLLIHLRKGGQRWTDEIPGGDGRVAQDFTRHGKEKGYYASLSNNHIQDSVYP